MKIDYNIINDAVKYRHICRDGSISPEEFQFYSDKLTELVAYMNEAEVSHFEMIINGTV